MYIYELPYTELKQCAIILDKNHLWEELGRVHMKFDESTIQYIKRAKQSGRSPSEILFTLWGNLNHTVQELFFLLSFMKNYNSMEVLKKFVDPKYHSLIEYARMKNDQKIPKNLNESEKVLDISRREMEGRNDEMKFELPDLPLRLDKNTRTFPVSEISSVFKSVGSIPQIPYEDLQKSTNNWNTSTVLGQGGYGTVFKGFWKYTKVAIKRIDRKDETHHEQMKQSITELYCLNTYRHDNVLSIYGYSIGGPQPCLVYQFMSGGSLEHRLHSKNPLKILNWPTRLNIAVGTARGLQFLHTIGKKPLIHGDIKSANILLDMSDTPKIGDFGLAREGPEDETHVMITKVQGTLPYLPDEFLRGKKFSTKVDTYSFGIVLFEIGTALVAHSTGRANKFLKDHVVEYEGNILDLKDSRAKGGESCFENLMEIGKLCVNKQANDRPEMIQVLSELEKIA